MRQQHAGSRYSVSALTFAVASLFGASAFANSLTFVSEPGDWVGQGETHSFSEGVTAAASTDSGTINVAVNTPDHWFYLDLAAPATQQLVPGVYNGAVRYPFQEPTQPGLSFFGDGRGCNTLTGTFTVTKAVYGPHGYIQEFEAGFEQHCEGLDPGLFGTVSISNPPPPPAMTFDLQLNSTGSVKRQTGVATVGGNVVCSATTTAQINGVVSQRVNRFAIASGNFYINVPCSTTPTNWSANVTPYGTPFGSGQAQVDLTGNAYDPNYGGFANDDVSAVVNLTGKK
jgi:hypothetical protein